MPETTTRAQQTERFDLRALYETSQLLSSSLDLEFVLNNLLLTAMSKLFVTREAALLYDPLEDAYRAAAVKGFLTATGVPDSRLEAGGKGEAEPCATNQDSQGRQRNRRVEIINLGSAS